MTDMQIVSNSGTNHLDQLKKLIQSGASRLIIASPYLATNMVDLLGEFLFSDIESIRRTIMFCRLYKRMDTIGQ